MGLIEKLQQIREGTFILEADDDKYSLKDTGDNTAKDGKDTTEPDDTNNNIDYSIPNDDTSDGTDDDSGGTNYDLPTDDDTSDDTGDGTGDPATTDDVNADGGDITDDTDQGSSDTSKPGEVLEIDPGSRDILQYRNFIAYRQLRDDAQHKLKELTELPSFSNVDRQVIDLAIDKLTELIDKLNDYILYRYKDTSYEKNYINFANFIVEKNLIMSLIEQINTTNK